MTGKAPRGLRGKAHRTPTPVHPKVSLCRETAQAVPAASPFVRGRGVDAAVRIFTIGNGPERRALVSEVINPGPARHVLSPRCHGRPPSRDLGGTRRNGPGILTRENDCKTAPHLEFVGLALASSIPVPPTQAERSRLKPGARRLNTPADVPESEGSRPFANVTGPG